MKNSNKEINTLSLWTWQTPGFSIIEDKVDHNLSEFNKIYSGYLKSCEELSGQIDTDQFIFCNTQDKPWGENRMKWELEVPKHRVRLICSITWNWILAKNSGNSNVCEPPEKFFNLSMNTKSHCFNSREEFESKFHSGWKDKTTKELWDALFVEAVQGTCTHALLLLPVDSEWVIYDPTDEPRK
jgi:hypothetical protein